MSDMKTPRRYFPYSTGILLVLASVVIALALYATR
jgi:hypothetical protein